MSKERKLLLVSIIIAILFVPFDFFVLSPALLKLYEISGISYEASKYDLAINVVSYLIYGIGVLYLMILTFNKKINLNIHHKGILIWSIYFILSSNYASGIIGLVAHSKLKKEKAKRKELPKIEYQEFTNKYICLAAFAVCMIIMFVVAKHITTFIELVSIYVIMFTLMVLVFRKQLVHDFKIFKQYFKEYILLALKTWGKSLVVLMIVGIILQLVTNLGTSNNQQTLQTMFNKMPIFVIILTMFYAPIVEELLFRGVFRKFIKSEYLFVLISGITFGLLHVIDDSKTLAEFSYVIVYSSLGMFLASLYYKTNNLFANISFHFFQNTLGVLAMLLLFLTK